MAQTHDPVGNFIDGSLRPSSKWLDKFNPHNGKRMYRFADASVDDVATAVAAASSAFDKWSALTPVERGRKLFELVALMKRDRVKLAACIALETGKPPRDAEGEVAAAIQQGEFFASEGMRLHGRSIPSSMAGKTSFTVRQPHGVAALIVPANTPIANIAWKAFPALICGNTIVLKAAEQSPRIANLFALLAQEAGLPSGAVNIVHGQGKIAGAALVDHPDVKIISFTGSTEVGRRIAARAGERLARVSLELGGKNALVVCDDADLAHAVHWTVLSAFSNAGQRCAAASRVLVFRRIVNEFRELLAARARSLRLGVADGCDLGPVISKQQQQQILAVIERSVADGGQIVCGGSAPDHGKLKAGFYIEPTIIEGLPPDAELCQEEIFGPVTVLMPVDGLDEALAIANGTRFGLTAAIHTRNVDRAMWFANRVRTGVVNINLGTFGSEPHMPFGGLGDSGNGTREPGVEALDVYSEVKNISLLSRPPENDNG